MRSPSFVVVVGLVAGVVGARPRRAKCSACSFRVRAQLSTRLSWRRPCVMRSPPLAASREWMVDRVAKAARGCLMRLHPQCNRGKTVSGVRMLDAVGSGTCGDESPFARDETGWNIRHDGQHADRRSRCCTGTCAEASFSACAAPEAAAGWQFPAGAVWSRRT